MSATWFYSEQGQQLGPVSTEVLGQLASAGRIAPGDLVWREGMAQWIAARDVPEVASLFPAPRTGRPAPPPLPPMAVPYYSPGPALAGADTGESAGMRWLLPVGRSGWAIAAGYLGLLSFILFPAPIALIVSLFAMSDLRKNPQLHGWGRAIFGLIMGILGTIVLLFMAIGVLARR